MKKTPETIIVEVFNSIMKWAEESAWEFVDENPDACSTVTNGYYIIVGVERTKEGGLEKVNPLGIAVGNGHVVKIPSAVAKEVFEVAKRKINEKK